MSQPANATEQVPRAPHTAAGSAGDSSALQHIREALNGLRYGILSIVVQDGVVIQIERTERRRLR